MVDHVADERMNLAVDERIRLENVWVALVFVGRFSLFQYVAERSEQVIIPVGVHEPFALNQRNVTLVHAQFLRLALSLSVHTADKFLIIFQLDFEHIAVVYIVTAVARFALLAPYLNHAASGNVAWDEEIIISLQRMTERFKCRAQCVLVTGIFVYLGKPFIFCRTMCEPLTQFFKRYVMHLSEAGHVPTSEVAHIVIYKEIVRLNIVRPTIQFIIAPAIPLALHHKSGD